MALGQEQWQWHWVRSNRKQWGNGVPIAISIDRVDMGVGRGRFIRIFIRNVSECQMEVRLT
jgi:hypothetical protein